MTAARRSTSNNLCFRYGVLILLNVCLLRVAPQLFVQSWPVRYSRFDFLTTRADFTQVLSMHDIPPSFVALVLVTLLM